MVEAGTFAGQIAEETIQQAEEHVRAALKKVEKQIRNIGYAYWPDKYTEEDDIS